LASLRLLSLVAVLVLLAAAPASADEPSLVDTAALMRADGVVRLPGLVIHGGTNQFVEASGSVCLTNGILEFIAVEPKGREYESLLALDARPSAMKFALLLIGCNPGPVPDAAKPDQSPGDDLSIEVAWEDQGTARQVPVQQWLLDRKTRQPPADLRWIFTGSGFVQGINGQEVFLADGEQAFISLWVNPAILINPARDFGNPYQGNDQGFQVNRAAVPSLGTPVKLILRKASAAGK